MTTMKLSRYTLKWYRTMVHETLRKEFYFDTYFVIVFPLYTLSPVRTMSEITSIMYVGALHRSYIDKFE